MRTYEIRHEEDGFVFECKAVPHEVTRWGWIDRFLLTQLSEDEAHRVGVFVRKAEGEPMEGMFERASRHIGRSE